MTPNTHVPGGTALPFARMDATYVNGPSEDTNGEWRVKLRIVPIKLHVYQETIDLVMQWITRVIGIISDDSEEPVLVDAILSPFTPTFTPFSNNRHGGNLGGHSLNNKSPVPFFQRVEIYPITLRIDYKPKRVNLPALQRGQVLELLNIFHLEGAEMTLRHVTVTGIQGWSDLITALISDWVPHVRNTQLPGMVSGVGPLRSLVNIGSGVADLFLLPVEQYKRDGRLVKGLKRGAHSFVRTAAVETLSIGAKLAVGTHSLLERADHLVSQPSLGMNKNQLSSSTTTTSSSSSITSTSIPLTTRINSTSLSPSSTYTTNNNPIKPISTHRVSKYAKQPRDTKEGLQQAIRTLSVNVTQAARIIAIPVETMERDGATGTMRAVLRAVPIAVLKPMLGATDAVGKTLMGIRNDLDPTRRSEVIDKYKSAE